MHLCTCAMKLNPFPYFQTLYLERVHKPVPWLMYLTREKTLQYWDSVDLPPSRNERSHFSKKDINISMGRNCEICGFPLYTYEICMKILIIIKYSKNRLETLKMFYRKNYNITHEY